MRRQLFVMDGDFCRKEREKYKSFYSPSGTDPRQYHIYWLYTNLANLA